MAVITLNEETVFPEREAYRMKAETDPTVREVTGAMFSQGLVAEGVDALARIGTSYDPDDDYDVFDDLQGYEKWSNRFIGVESREEAVAIKRRIDGDLNARETMAAGSGLETAAAMIASMAVDPINLVPIGGTAYKTYRSGGRILEGAAKTAAVGMAVSTGEELVLQNLQEIRSADESFMNVGATTLLSGLLGGASAFVGGRSQIDDLARRMDEELSVPDYSGSTAGAQAVPDTTLAQETLKDAFGLEKALSFNDPVLRTLNSPSKITRQISENLAETYLYKNKNSDFIASQVSAENMIKSYNLPKYNFFREYDDLFLQYRGNKSKIATQAQDMFGRSRKDGMLTYQEFGQEVIRAARRNDTHDIPEVAKAAAALRREVFDPIYARGVDAGNFEEGASVKTAPSYVTRLWDNYKILDDLPRFKKINAQWMRERRDAIAETIPDLEQKIEKDRETIRMRNKEVKAVREATMQSVLETAEENMGFRVNQALQDIKVNGKPEIKPKTKDDVVAQAKRAQNRAYLKSLQKEISDGLADEIDDALQAEYRAIVSRVVKETDEINGDEFFDFIKDDLLPPLRDAAGDVGGEKARDRISFGQSEAVRKSVDSFNKSVEAQLKRLGKELSDEQLEKKIIAQITADIKKSARASAQKAARSAVKELQAELDQMLIDLKDTKKQLASNKIKAGQLDEEIDNVVDELVNRILSTPAGRLPYDVKLRREGGARPPEKQQLRGAAKERVYDIPDELVEDFLVNDVDAVVESYVHSLASDIELTKKFGGVDYTDTLKRIEEDYSRLSKGADAKTQRLLKRAFDNDVRDIKGMWERLRGTYALPDDYAKFLPVAERTALNWNYMRLLGGMTISAFPDVARPIMAHGLGRVYQDGVRAAVKNFKAFRGAAEEIKEAGTALDMVLNTRARAIAGMDEYMPFTNRLEAATGAMSRHFGVISLMSPWNAALKQFTGVITQGRFIRSVSDLAAGKKLPKAEIENLAANFIDEDMAKRIAAQYVKHGEEIDGIVIPKAQIWDDIEAQTVFRAAIRREVDALVVTPGQDKALWMSRPGWRLIGQFKSFAVASVQRTMLSGLQKRDMAVMNGMALSLFLGMGVYAAKTKLSGRDTSDDWRVWLSEGVDRSGLTGWAFDANNIVEKVSRGRIGVNALIGGPPMSRYASRSVADALLGPTYGTIGNAIQVSGSAFQGDWRASDTHALRKLMPYQNIFYIRGIFDEAEKGINAVLGVPERKRQ